jgi:hypothetical protein
MSNLSSLLISHHLMTLNPHKLTTISKSPFLAQIFSIIGAKNHISRNKTKPLVVTYGNIMSGLLGGAVSAGLSVVTGGALTQESESKDQAEQEGQSELQERGETQSEMTLGSKDGRNDPKVPH